MQGGGIAHGTAFDACRCGGRTDGGAVFLGGFAFCRCSGGGKGGDGGLVDGGLVVKEDEDVVERGAEFVGKDF